MEEAVKLLPVILMGETAKEAISAQVVLMQLQIAKSYVFPDSSRDVVMDIGESGGLEPVPDGNDNFQFSLDDDDLRIFSCILSNDKMALFTITLECNAKPQFSASTAY